MTASPVLARPGKSYIPVFVDSTSAVLSTMLGWKATASETTIVDATPMLFDITGIIGFGGALQGTIVISVEKEVAFAASEIFLGDRPTQVDNDVRDLVAELANMIAGGAKERIGLAAIALGLPTSVSGDGHVVNLDRGAVVECVCFECPDGRISVMVAIRD